MLLNLRQEVYMDKIYEDNDLIVSVDSDLGVVVELKSRDNVGVRIDPTLGSLVVQVRAGSEMVVSGKGMTEIRALT